MEGTSLDLFFLIELKDYLIFLKHIMRCRVHSEFGVELMIDIQEAKQMKKQGNSSL